MKRYLDDLEERLLAGLADVARGPRQNALFALWIVVRLCDGMLPPSPLSVAVRRRRLAGAERRLASLTLPAPMRRGLTAALRELAAGQPGAGALVLQQLAAPAREAIGADVAEALAGAAHRAREAGRIPPPGVAR